MAIEYYVKRKPKGGKWAIVETCKTSLEAQRQTKLYNDRRKSDMQYAVFYSPDALEEYGKRRSA